MAVEIEFGRVREVGTELEEEWPKVAVNAVEVIVVDHRRGAIQPGIPIPTMGAMALRGAKGRRLLLRLTDQHNLILTGRPRHVGCHDIIFPLSFLKRENGDVMLLSIGVNRRHKRLTDRSHRRRRRDRAVPLMLQKPTHVGFALQARNVNIQVHAVNTLNFQGDMLAQNFGQRHGCDSHVPLRLRRPFGNGYTVSFVLPQPEPLIPGVRSLV